VLRPLWPIYVGACLDDRADTIVPIDRPSSCTHVKYSLRLIFWSLSGPRLTSTCFWVRSPQRSDLQLFTSTVLPNRLALANATTREFNFPAGDPHPSLRQRAAEEPKTVGEVAIASASPDVNFPPQRNRPDRSSSIPPIPIFTTCSVPAASATVNRRGPATCFRWSGGESVAKKAGGRTGIPPADACSPALSAALHGCATAIPWSARDFLGGTIYRITAPISPQR